jgi:adhesin/invasin
MAMNKTMRAHIRTTDTPVRNTLTKLGVWTGALLLVSAAYCLLYEPAHAAESGQGVHKKSDIVAIKAISLTLTAEPTVVLADGSSAAVVTATVTDAGSGGKIENATVSVGRSSGVQASVSPGTSQTTDEDGNTIFTVRSSTAGVVALSGTAGSDEPSFASAENLEITFVAAPNELDAINLVAAPTTLDLNTRRSATITATVTKNNGEDNPGKDVSFFATGGTLSKTSGKTNDSGQVTTTFTAIVSGTAIITATSGNLHDQLQIPVTAPPPSGNSGSVTVTLAFTLANGATTALITATLFGPGNQPVSGQSITFTVPPGVQVNPVSGTSNGSGIVTTSVTSPVSGSIIVTATPDQGIPVQITITLSALPGPDTRLLLPLAQRTPNPDELPLVAIKNGDFEAPGSWAFSRPDIIYPCKDLIGAPLKSGCGGSQVAWLGGVRSTSTFTIAQPITMTNWYPVQVRFRYFVESTRTDCNSDKAQVWFGQTLLGNTTFALCRQDSSTAWQTVFFELPRIAATGSLRFESQLAGGEISSFFVDDVSLCTTSSYRHPAMPVCP